MVYRGTGAWDGEGWGGRDSKAYMERKERTRLPWAHERPAKGLVHVAETSNCNGASAQLFFPLFVQPASLNKPAQPCTTCNQLTAQGHNKGTTTQHHTTCMLQPSAFSSYPAQAAK